MSHYQWRIAQALGLDAAVEQLTAHMAAKAATPVTTSQLVDANGVGLSVEVPDAFIDLVVDESELLKLVRVHRTNKPSGDIAKVTVQGPITEYAEENSAATETRAHTPGSVHFQTRKVRSLYDFTTEAEEDNIEGPSGVSTLLDALRKQVANDVETLSIEGDESQVGTDDYSRLVKANDGWNVLTGAGTGTHLVNAGNTRVSWKLLSKMVKSMPTKWRRGDWKRRFKFLCTPDVHQQLLDEAQERATGLGDGVWRGNEDNVSPLGIQVVEVPLIPQDLAGSGTASSGTFLWLMDPRNFIYVIQRQMTMHREFRPRSDKMEFTLYHRPDFIVENTDAIVKAVNVLTDEAVARYGA